MVKIVPNVDGRGRVLDTDGKVVMTKKTAVAAKKAVETMHSKAIAQGSARKGGYVAPAKKAAPAKPKVKYLAFDTPVEPEHTTRERIQAAIARLVA